MKKLFLLALTIICPGCVSVPDGIEPIKGFDSAHYLGKWYEIARLDHSFESGLNNVTAQYSLSADGGIIVLNRGYDEQAKKWKEAKGRAYFVGSKDTGFLKVSFFGPFYGSYIIFGLERNDYQYSFVCGPDRKYLWLLCRTSRISEALKQRFILEAKNLGFETDKLVFVKHN
jgi:apolipoprotein D and lipocalin family protein